NGRRRRRRPVPPLLPPPRARPLRTSARRASLAALRTRSRRRRAPAIPLRGTPVGDGLRILPTLRTTLATSRVGEEVTVRGWVRAARRQKDLTFVWVNDGSTFDGLQAVLEGDFRIDRAAGCFDAAPPATPVSLLSLGLGDCVELIGILSESPAKGQELELTVERAKLVQGCDREQVTNTFTAMWRVRNAAVQGIHQFMSDNECIQVHTPVITSLDCEGAGEVFRVSSNSPESGAEPPTPPASPPGPGSSPQRPEYFGKPSYLTVSGQLQLEAVTQSLLRTYSFGPVFRAEQGMTARHLSEFWMVEAELAFVTDLPELLDFTEGLVRAAARAVARERAEDVRFFRDRIDKDVVRRIERLCGASGDGDGQAFARMTYTEAVRALLHPANCAPPFENPVRWGRKLASEHEKWLASVHVGGPVFVTDYPAGLKPFYMRLNGPEEVDPSLLPPPDTRTAAAFDLLVPAVGELAGGSLREHCRDALGAAMDAAGLLASGDYDWYLDLRRFGGAPTAGFGLGFERFLMYITGMESARDCIPVPRVPGSCLL
ncbi:MAG: asparaginyl-tRNA synthetase, partial [Olpidium bornovanus]